MKKNLLPLIVLLLFFSFRSQSQIYTEHNMYPENMFLYNPAFAGSAGQLGIFTDYKHHLAAIEDAPRTIILGIHSPLFAKMGIGGMIKTERIGLYETMIFRLDYAYRTKLTDNQSLALGLKTGLLQRNFNTEDVIIFDDTDPTLYADYYKKNIIYYGGGLDYHFRNFSLSLSLPVMYRTSDALFYRTLTDIGYDFYFGAGKRFGLKPEISVFTRETTLSHYDFHLTASLQKQIWLRAAYKSGNSFVGSIGVALGKIGISYAYETNNKTLSYIGGATHEVSLSYGLVGGRKLKPDPEPIDTVLIPEKEEYVHRLRHMIENETYEQFVKAGNFAFYNEIIALTDSMYRSTPPPDETEEVIAETDTTETDPKNIVVKPDTTEIDITEIVTDTTARSDTITDTTVENTATDNSKPNPVDELTEYEKKVFEKGVHFAEGSAMLTANSREYLDQVADLMRKNEKLRIQITGYTCDIGSRETNLKISKERAETVRYYLSLQGISQNRITTDGRADAEPVVPNTNENNRQQNRRVAFSILR